MKRLTFFLTMVFLAAGGILERAHAQAQSYPSRPIHMIVPFPPGGGFDGIARPFSEKLGAILGQPMLLEHRPGSGGNIGAEVAARSAPDGYTLLFANSFLSTNPAMYASLRYDPLKDFVAITRVGLTNTALAQADVIERLRKAGYEPGSSTSEVLAATLKADLQKWSRVVTDAKIPKQ